MVGYYDIVLGVVPISTVGLPSILAFFGFSLQVSVVLGSVISILVIGHGLFVRGPTDTSEEVSNLDVKFRKESEPPNETLNSLNSD